MFDLGITDLVNGTDIDKPKNALTLTMHFRKLFDAFKASFDAIPNQPNTYKIDSISQNLIKDPLLPVTRTLRHPPNCRFDPPSPRLLAVHHAIARILHLTGAGDYIDRVLRDLESPDIAKDGSTEIEAYVGLKIGGWLAEAQVH